MPAGCSARSTARCLTAGSPPPTSSMSTRTAPAPPRTTRPKRRRSSARSAPMPASSRSSSNKSMIGHALGAAGALELVATLMSDARRRGAADDQLSRAGPGLRSGLCAERGAPDADRCGAVEFVRVRRLERCAGGAAFPSSTRACPAIRYGQARWFARGSARRVGSVDRDDPRRFGLAQRQRGCRAGSWPRNTARPAPSTWCRADGYRAGRPCRCGSARWPPPGR